jgi:hypothetical protein
MNVFNFIKRSILCSNVLFYSGEDLSIDKDNDNDKNIKNNHENILKDKANDKKNKKNLSPLQQLRDFLCVLRNMVKSEESLISEIVEKIKIQSINRDTIGLIVEQNIDFIKFLFEYSKRKNIFFNVNKIIKGSLEVSKNIEETEDINIKGKYSISLFDAIVKVMEISDLSQLWTELFQKKEIEMNTLLSEINKKSKDAMKLINVYIEIHLYIERVENFFIKEEGRNNDIQIDIIDLIEEGINLNTKYQDFKNDFEITQRSLQNYILNIDQYIEDGEKKNRDFYREKLSFIYLPESLLNMYFCGYINGFFLKFNLLKNNLPLKIIMDSNSQNFEKLNQNGFLNIHINKNLLSKELSEFGDILKNKTFVLDTSLDIVQKIFKISVDGEINLKKKELSLKLEFSSGDMAESIMKILDFTKIIFLKESQKMKNVEAMISLLKSIKMEQLYNQKVLELSLEKLRISLSMMTQLNKNFDAGITTYEECSNYSSTIFKLLEEAFIKELNLYLSINTPINKKNCFIKIEKK